MSLTSFRPTENTAFAESLSFLIVRETHLAKKPLPVRLPISSRRRNLQKESDL
jgi:hypothetical protein